MSEQGRDGFDLVTGGAGFIGSHLCDALTDAGRAVTVMDDFSTGKPRNLERVRSRAGDRLKVVQADIRERAGLKAILRGVRTVYHLAAMTSVEESVRNPFKVNSVNLEGTLSVLEAAREAGAAKLVFASSTSVYGNSGELPQREDGRLSPVSPYAVSKLAGEHYCRLYSELYGLPTLCLRFFNVYGPRQDPQSPYAAVVPRFIDRILREQPPVIFGDGLQTRDFVYVGDVVFAMVSAAGAAASGMSLNVASGRSVNLITLAQELNKVARRDFEPIHEEPRLGEARHSAASIELAGRAVGFAPRVTLEEGLKRTFEWFRERHLEEPIAL